MYIMCVLCVICTRKFFSVQAPAISKDAKDYLTEKATLIATTDLRPSTVIEGEGFQFIDQVSRKVILVLTALY